MYTPLRHYQSLMLRKGANTDRGGSSGKSEKGDDDASAHEGGTAAASKNGTGHSYSHTYSHSGMLRGRTLLDQNTFSNSNSSYPLPESYHASGSETKINNNSAPNLQTMASARQDQESVGILESRPSSMSSANDNAMVAKTPTFEYYGFVVYLVSLAAFFVYLMWAYLPDNVLEAIGITYYPDRYWALALPAWWMTAVAFVYLFNMAANMYNTPLLNSMDNITDSYSNMPKDMSKAGEFYSSEIRGIPPVSDLPISLVNKCLYQESES